MVPVVASAGPAKPSKTPPATTATATALAMLAIFVVFTMEASDVGLVDFSTNSWSHRVGNVVPWLTRRPYESGRRISMIEVLPDMPQGVTGIRVSGRVGGEEIR